MEAIFGLLLIIAPFIIRILGLCLVIWIISWIVGDIFGTGQSKREKQLEKHLKRAEADLELERQHQLRVAAQQLTRPAPFPSDNWVDYAQRNPEVTLQMVEKIDVVDGYFAAEKHMKMSGPLPEKPRAYFYPPIDLKYLEKQRRQEWLEQCGGVGPVVGPEAFGGGPTRIS